MRLWCNTIFLMSIFRWIYLPWWMLQLCNAIVVMPVFQWMYLAIEMPSWCNAVLFLLIFRWIHPPLRMLQRRNAVGITPLFQWMYFTIYMRPWRNAVGVVLLIARGWRGTSLPRVNVRKGIQRHRCWAFSVKARLQWNLSWRINQRNRNTYGVVPRKPYINPG